MHGDAQALVACLRQLVELEEEATRSVAESRERASLTESTFREAMQAKQEGRSFQPNVSKLLGSGSELSRTQDRTRKQEVTFMQCWRILMRVSADPRLREPAERVADHLERYRLVRYETDPDELRDEIASRAMPEIDPNAPREIATGRIMDFMGSMGMQFEGARSAGTSSWLGRPSSCARPWPLLRRSPRSTHNDLPQLVWVQACKLG